METEKLFCLEGKSSKLNCTLLNGLDGFYNEIRSHSIHKDNNFIVKRKGENETFENYSQ